MLGKIALLVGISLLLTQAAPATASCNIFTQWECYNDRCIYASYKCDGDDDCGDGSDESSWAGCLFPRSCSWGEWECSTWSQCVSTLDKCDGRQNCIDGSDETTSAGCYDYSGTVTTWVSLGVGSIVGIVIGVIFFIIVIVVASYYCCCRSTPQRTTVIAPSQPATVSYVSSQQQASYSQPGGYGYGPPQGPPAYGSPPAATAYPPPTLAPGASPYNNDPAYPPMKQ